MCVCVCVCTSALCNPLVALSLVPKPALTHTHTFTHARGPFRERTGRGSLQCQRGFEVQDIKVVVQTHTCSLSQPTHLQPTHPHIHKDQHMPIFTLSPADDIHPLNPFISFILPGLHVAVSALCAGLGMMRVFVATVDLAMNVNEPRW